MKSKPVEYLPGAWLDFEESVAWYEEQENGAGDRFATAVTLAEQKLKRNPPLGTPHRRNTRKWRVQRFPHSIVYRDEPHRIVIVAIAHPKRQENYWEYRID
jgi:plasmid stabilization system protein ParE